MPSHTFDAWLQYSADLNAKREVSGKYGVDFRTPEPNDVHRRTLRLLRKLKELEPAMMKVNGEQFDYLDDVQAGTHPFPLAHNGGGGGEHHDRDASTPRAERRPQPAWPSSAEMGMGMQMAVDPAPTTMTSSRAQLDVGRPGHGQGQGQFGPLAAQTHQPRHAHAPHTGAPVSLVPISAYAQARQQAQSQLPGQQQHQQNQQNQHPHPNQHPRQQQQQQQHSGRTHGYTSQFPPTPELVPSYPGGGRGSTASSSSSSSSSISDFSRPGAPIHVASLSVSPPSTAQTAVPGSPYAGGWVPSGSIPLFDPHGRKVMSPVTLPARYLPQPQQQQQSYAHAQQQSQHQQEHAQMQHQQHQQQQQHQHSHSHYHQHQQQQPHLEPDPYDPYDMADMVHIRGRPYTLRLNTDLTSAPSASGAGPGAGAGVSLGGWLHDNIDDDFSVSASGSTPGSSIPGVMGVGMDVDHGIGHGLDHDHPQPQSCPPSMMTVPSQVGMAMPRVGKGAGLGQVQGTGHGQGQSQPISFYSPRVDSGDEQDERMSYWRMSDLRSAMVEEESELELGMVRSW